MLKRLASRAALAATILLSAAHAMATNHPAFKVEVTGTGAPIILIPGLASPGEVWDGTVRRYCGTRQCHVLTLAGFAGTPAIDAPLLPSAEQQLSDYIAENKLDKPLLVGHSMGAFLALKLAADHPDQVGRIVVVDTLPALGAVQVPDLSAAQLEAVAAQMRDRMLQADDKSFAAQQRRVADVQIELADTARHFIMYDDPDWMYARIDQFLK